MKTRAEIFLLITVFLALPLLCDAQDRAQSVPSSRNVAEILGIPVEQGGKCGSSAIFLAYSRWNQLSLETRGRILKALERPKKQTYRDSPSGKFRIHYDAIETDSTHDTPALITSGPDRQRIPKTVEQYIDSVAYYFDYAWKLEVDTLGYPRPPSDGLDGGGPQLDIYVGARVVNDFGQTVPDGVIESGSPPRYRSYIEIDNDFLGYRTQGIAALCITAVHEFHHSIQMGIYGDWWTDPPYDSWFYELTSVWIEHVGFPGISDYLIDLPNYLQRFRDGLSRSYPLNTTVYPGYERSIWAHFLTKRFGRDVIKEIWTGMKLVSAIASTADVLQQRGSSLQSEYALFSLWNYYTADRADPDRYYDAGSSFPRFLPNVSSTFNGLSASISSSAYPLSTQFVELALSKDTITAVIANVDVAAAQTTNPSMPSFDLQLSNGRAQPPYQKIAAGLALAFKVADIKQWRTVYLLGSTRANVNSAPVASPNPLWLAQNKELLLPVGNSSANHADVYLLNSAMELVFSRQYPITASLSGRSVRIPTGDFQKSVASGVYFIVARCIDAEFRWKVAILQ